MSRSQNVWVSKCLHLYTVEQYLDGPMSGWQNILLSKCLGVKKRCVKMSGGQNVRCRNVGESHEGLLRKGLPSRSFTIETLLADTG